MAPIGHMQFQVWLYKIITYIESKYVLRIDLQPKLLLWTLECMALNNRVLSTRGKEFLRKKVFFFLRNWGQYLKFQKS